jgi:hypothetical protein
MPTESGYSNTKKLGKPLHKTLQRLGSGHVGQFVSQKGLAEKTALPVAIAAVAVNADSTLISLEITAHGAAIGDVCRFYSGAISGAELEVVGVPDANHVVIRNVVGVPVVADTVKLMSWVTLKTDAEGNLNFQPGSTSFVRDAAIQQVVEDTANAANNRALPNLVMFYRDGILRPVLEDSVTPANNDPLPVKLTGVTGDVIINAGDLQVAVNATNDSVAIGDPVTGASANVTTNATTTLEELHVTDDEVIAQLVAANATLTSIAAEDFATQTTLAAVDTKLGTLLTEDFAQEATLATRASEATLADVRTAVQLLDNVVNTDGTASGAQGVLIGGVDGVGNFQAASVNTAGEVAVTFSTAGFATEATLSTINNKLVADFGTNALAIRTAAQIGNATGGANFGAGGDDAQTLRVSANLKRLGNELAYNSGAADANTLRSVLATRHEAAATPLSVQISNGTNFVGTSSVAGNAQKTVNTGGTTLKAAAFVLGWDGSLHREFLVDTSGRQVCVDQTKVYADDRSTVIANTGVTTIAIPSGTQQIKIQALDSNSVNLRMRIDADPTASAGLQFQPGRSEDFEVGGTQLRFIAESAATGQGVEVTFMRIV